MENVTGVREGGQEPQIPSQQHPGPRDAPESGTRRDGACADPHAQEF